MVGEEPRTRDRLLGRWFAQCPTCRSHRRHGPDCPGGPIPARRRRKQERRSWKRWVRAELDG